MMTRFGIRKFVFYPLAALILSAAGAHAQTVTVVEKLTTDPADQPWPGGVIYKRFVVSGLPTASRGYISLPYTDTSLGEAGASPTPTLFGDGSYLAACSVTGTALALGNAKVVVLDYMYNTLAISTDNEYTPFTITTNPSMSIRRPQKKSTRKKVAQIPKVAPNTATRNRTNRQP